MACRNIDRAEKAAEQIRQETGNKDVVAKQLDVSSLKSVREFASNFMRSEYRLDVLVNNAGVTGNFITMSTNHFTIHLILQCIFHIFSGYLISNYLGLPFEKTEDGLELMFATNHFGPFLLTNLLLGEIILYLFFSYVVRLPVSLCTIFLAHLCKLHGGLLCVTFRLSVTKTHTT